MAASLDHPVFLNLALNPISSFVGLSAGQFVGQSVRRSICWLVGQSVADCFEHAIGLAQLPHK